MPALKQSEIAAVQQEVKELTAPIIPRIRILKIIDANTLAQADSFLSKICSARKVIEVRLKRILDPLNEARNEVLNLRREMDAPLLQLEAELREGMKDYRMLEIRKEREAEEKRLQERRRIEAEAAKKLAQENAAKTEAMRKRLAAQREELEAKAVEVTAAPLAPPVTLMNSGTRTERRVRITDRKAFLAAVVAGEVPDDVITIDMSTLERYRKMNEALVKSWPGTDIQEDVIIVRRRA
jgi:hypothetical protein